ncbi:MAG: hypothetical protein KDC98_26050 [Planctomycetes bacterium]|nr:hypothetical protein [Planctomycetota bacterium]
MSSLLEQARARAAARRERQITITLPELDLDLLCDVPTDSFDIERMQKAAAKVNKGRGTATHFARALIAAQVREIRIGGELVEVDGETVAFNDPELWRELNVADAKSAVVELIGTDADALTIATELMTEAGFTGRDDDDDPI